MLRKTSTLRRGQARTYTRVQSPFESRHGAFPNVAFPRLTHTNAPVLPAFCHVERLPVHRSQAGLPVRRRRESTPGRHKRSTVRHVPTAMSHGRTFLKAQLLWRCLRYGLKKEGRSWRPHVPTTTRSVHEAQLRSPTIQALWYARATSYSLRVRMKPLNDVPPSLSAPRRLRRAVGADNRTCLARSMAFRSAMKTSTRAAAHRLGS